MSALLVDRKILEQLLAKDIPHILAHGECSGGWLLSDHCVSCNRCGLMMKFYPCLMI